MSLCYVSVLHVFDHVLPLGHLSERQVQESASLLSLLRWYLMAEIYELALLVTHPRIVRSLAVLRCPQCPQGLGMVV